MKVELLKRSLERIFENSKIDDNCILDAYYEEEFPNKIAVGFTIIKKT